MRELDHATTFPRLTMEKTVSRLTITFLMTLIGLGLIKSVHAETIHVPGDHNAIQAAIDAAKSGDTVLVAAGRYQERIRMKQGVTLRSAGDETPGKLGLRRAEATMIDGRGSGQGPGVAMADDAIIDGFTVTGVGSYDEEKWIHHHATQGNQQSHEHIGQPGTPGISAMGVSCVIRNNLVHHIGYTGIAVLGASGRPSSPHIYRNICYRNMGGGIGSMQKSTAVIEENTCFENFYAGIGHDDASPTVINNVCYRNIRAGIGISHGACPVVRGNKCYENRRAGIGTRTGSETRPLIEDNDCFDNHMAGIGAENNASPLIRNNRCYRNKLAGIGSRTGATPIIIGNECYQNEKVGIGQQSDAATILVDNHCHHNKAAGIGFESCQRGQATVVNNRVIDNQLVAVGVKSGWEVSLSGNQLSRSGGMPPMVMIHEGADATLINNDIRGSGVAGIRVAGVARIIENSLTCESMRPSGPPNFAVWALPGSVVNMTGNTIQGWRHGLHASEASIMAAKNQISNFHATAIVIKDSRSAAIALENLATTKDAEAQVISVSGKAALIRDNTLTTGE